MTLDRRTFLGTSIAAGAAVASLQRSAWAGGEDRVRVGLVGCGGRGTGAIFNAVAASPDVEVTALADLFPDRLNACRTHLDQLGDRVRLDESACHVGWDAYQSLCARPDVDLVVLATPPHFRPMMLTEAIAGGKHVFMEKPVAVCPAGVRAVMAAGDDAAEKGLSIVAGTQRRHESCYLDAMRRIRDGDIGDVVAARCYWNQGGLWNRGRQDGWSDMEWQLRNWLYFTWLSGDHIVEQHVHNLDVVNWAMGSHPVSCIGMGGRQSRTQPEYGHCFDHFAIDYEYPGGVHALSMCRQADGSSGKVGEVIQGTKGRAVTSSGQARFEGGPTWTFGGENPNPYVAEHQNLQASIRGDGPYLNEARRIAASTLTAIMGRMSAYSGRELTWEEALTSPLDLTPPAYTFSAMHVPAVAVPGRTSPHDGLWMETV